MADDMGCAVRTDGNRLGQTRTGLDGLDRLVRFGQVLMDCG